MAQVLAFLPITSLAAYRLRVQHTETAMTSNSSTATYTTPLLPWMNLGLKLGEMMLTSSRVITHRTRGVLTAHPDPREGGSMDQERIDAGYASAMAMAMGANLAKIYIDLGALAYKQWMATTASLTALALHRPSFVQPARLISETTSQSAAAASELSAATVELAPHGLEPAHTRATKNAKRLGKTKHSDNSQRTNHAKRPGHVKRARHAKRLER